MFGVSSFAQTPFSTLPSSGAFFALEIIENVEAADTNTQVWSFLQSITEPIPEVADFTSQAGLFFGAINENLVVDDSSTQQFNYLHG